MPCNCWRRQASVDALQLLLAASDGTTRRCLAACGASHRLAQAPYSLLGMDFSATAGMLVDGRYRLEQQIGQGGMGSVWIAEDEKLLRWVAVKILSDKCVRSPGITIRFEREAMALAKLRSPHVVQVFDYGTLEQGAYMVMELLHGMDLHEWFTAERPCPLSSLVSIIKQIGRGLEAIHKGGLIHRDLKPSNVFVLEDEGPMTIKIFDFGLAKGTDEIMPVKDRTEAGVLLGTPRFMSPEQAEGAGAVDSRSDLWSLGVIAFLGFTGQLPFRGRGIGEIIAKIATRPHPVPSTLMSGVVPSMDRFFDKALAKAPEARFEAALAMAAAFEHAANIQAKGEEIVPLALPSQVRQSSDDTLHDFDDDVTYDEDIVPSGEAEPGPLAASDAKPLPALETSRPAPVRIAAAVLLLLAAWLGWRALSGAGQPGPDKNVSPANSGSVVPRSGSQRAGEPAPLAPAAKAAGGGKSRATPASADLPLTGSSRPEASAAASGSAGTRVPFVPAPRPTGKALPVTPSATPSASPSSDQGLQHFDDRH